MQYSHWTKSGLGAARLTLDSQMDDELITQNTTRLCKLILSASRPPVFKCQFALRHSSPREHPRLSATAARMAEPLSITASVAGIISLGIESCKLIVKYCDDIRGADDQIDSIALKAGGLLSTLQQIDALLKETDGVHPKITSDIREKVLQNETWITKINERVARLSPATSSNGLGDKLRATAKKAAYPLKKDSLLSTVEILQGVQMNLHTALLT